jgi:hypothetical protein
VADSDHAVSLWRLHATASEDAKPLQKNIGGAISHPDLVAFSPKGKTAVLYSQVEGLLQVIEGLPDTPAIVKTFSTPNTAAIRSILVTDDGALMAAKLSAHEVFVLTADGNWQSLPGGYSPEAWSFLPNSHDLVLSDNGLKSVVLLSNVGGPSSTSKSLAQGVQVDKLALGNNGDFIALAETSSRRLLAISLRDGKTLPLTASTSIDCLIPLRDGYTFLLSTAPPLALIKLGIAFEKAPNSPGNAVISLSQEQVER